MSLDEIKRRRAEKPEEREKKMEQAKKEVKDRQKKMVEAKKADKSKVKQATKTQAPKQAAPPKKGGKKK